MTQYLYPQNLKATANLWLWGLRDFCILGIAALLSIVALVQLRIVIPAAATLCYGFLTIRLDDTTILDFMKYAVRYFMWDLIVKKGMPPTRMVRYCCDVFKEGGGRMRKDFERYYALLVVGGTCHDDRRR